jgi:hypothetical protein
MKAELALVGALQHLRRRDPERPRDRRQAADVLPPSRASDISETAPKRGLLPALLRYPNKLGDLSPLRELARLAIQLGVHRIRLQCSLNSRGRHKRKFNLIVKRTRCRPAVSRPVRFSDVEFAVLSPFNFRE